MTVPDNTASVNKSDTAARRFSGRDEVELATTITYEDGRQATIRSRVHVEDVEGALAHA